MEDKEMDGSDDARARYVWDREKLSWVETEEGSRSAEAESAVEQPLSDGVEDVSPIAVSMEGEELQLRGAFIRLVGILIDMVILLILASIIQVIFGTDSTASAFLMPLLGFAFFVGFWTLRGQTPGKMAIGGKIVRSDGSPIGLARSFVRYLVFLGYFLALSIGRESLWLIGVVVVVAFSVVALSRSKRGLHDLAAGTMVINSRPQLMEDYEEEVWEAPESESDALLLEED